MDTSSLHVTLFCSPLNMTFKKGGIFTCNDTGPRILKVSPKGPLHLVPLNVYDNEETDDTDTSKSVCPACGHSGVRIPDGTDQKLFRQVMA